MRTSLMLLLTAVLLLTAPTFAQQRQGTPETMTNIVDYDEATAPSKASSIEKHGFTHGPATESFVGTPTGLTGFYDYQVNGGAAKYIWVNPQNPNKIHVCYMLATDSTSPGGPTRRAGYAFSSNGGATWSSISSVSGIREGFPSMTILNQGGGSYLGVVAYHSQPTGDRLLARAAIDGDEGLSSFAVVSPSDPGANPSVGGNLIWPYITANPAGTRMWMMASFSGGPGTVHFTTYNVASGQFDANWSPTLITEEGDTLGPGGRYNVVVSPSGNRVTMYHLGGPSGRETYVSFSESTDGGATFPAFKRLTKLTPTGPGIGVITTATDSIAPWIGVDAVYRGENLCFVFSTGRYVGGGYQFRGQGIWFWSQATGFRNVVDTTRIQALLGSNWEGYIRPAGAKSQVNHFPIDYPTIGVTPNGDLHCVFVVARRDTSGGTPSAAGFNYYTVAYTKSTDGGLTWSAPRLLETNPTMDFRYPSIAEFNPDNNFVNVVYQQDPQPGSGAFSDQAPVSRAQLLFQRVSTLSASDGRERIADYRLEQNYPNPFNPTTTIAYVLPKAEKVSLKVYDVLGREVATLVNEVKGAGAHATTFDAANLASGVYFYRLQAGSFSQTKKMMLVK
ncbi:MAG: T9SS type A sorting domain-containing protein [Chloroherpetonaceae bacterium]|nr:T9SS type A sorting domain-containing protein [Chloroherpetonaceae bacterium]MDW8438065.1 T9SS type A sorting domain-containing protein [Chloroherpetonaceae bacterium]